MKIFVGGISSSGWVLIRAAFPDLDLVYGSCERDPQRWRKQCKHCDLVVLQTKFIGHKYVEAIRSAGIKKIVFSNGGVNGIIEAIRSAYEKDASNHPPQGRQIPSHSYRGDR